VLTFGGAPDDDWRLEGVTVGEAGTTFTVRRGGEPFGAFTTALWGAHYALDAVAAMALAVGVAGVDLVAVRRALTYFRGTARRLEHRGSCNGAPVFDDYAHHPTEVAATLAALRLRYPGRPLWCVFQSHTFSRTETFLDEFATALRRADHVLVPPIYASAREQGGAVTHEALAAAVNGGAAGVAVAVPSFEAAAERVRHGVGAGDVVVTMGAGDVWRVADLLLR
jgi:UDP-N-acetylmuramate--alanine ligase